MVSIRTVSLYTNCRSILAVNLCPNLIVFLTNEKEILSGKETRKNRLTLSQQYVTLLSEMR